MDHDQIPLAFRPYITAIEEHCRSLSKEELVETILSLAGSVPPRERASFLDRISEGSGRGVRGLDADDLITRIEGIREEIEARISAIEDGSYWDEYQDEFDDRYDWDDEPASITEEHTSVLGSLLDEAGALFLDGDLVHAAAAYRLLLATFDEYDPYEASFELREHRARYARIVYLLTAADERLERMIEAMRSEADPLFFTESDDEELVDLDDAMPMFADVLDAAPDALPELNHFLRSWIERFDASESARAQSLYLEAVYLTDGLDGLEATARRWGKDRPRAYLAWIERLAKHGAWERVALASREALGTISVGEPRVASFRYRAGEYLEKAGERLADRSLRNEGASEMFSVRPTEDTLAKLLRVSPERRDESLAQAACLLSGRSQRRYLYVEVLLMAGRVEETLEIARTCEPVGWSSYDNPGGVCFASFLAMPVVEDLRAYPTIHSLLE